MKKIYLGCDLFIDGQRKQAVSVKDKIIKGLEAHNKINGTDHKVSIYNPAENLEINDKSAGFATGAEILSQDYERLKGSDYLIALMDTEDLGLAAEMGIAFEREIPIFQLYTDIRLGGNDKQDKIEGLQNDIFQNDFLYINKLVTGLSYADKFGKPYENPLVYRREEDLIEEIINYLTNN